VPPSEHAESCIRPAPDRARRARRVVWLGLVAIVGLAARIWLIALAPDHSYLNDHVDFMIWSEWAYRYGPTSLYDLSGRTLVNAHLPRYMDDHADVTPYPAFNSYNYPPLAGYLMWLQGLAWPATNRPVETHTVEPSVAALVGIPGGQLTSPIVNTTATRAINSAFPIVADYLMAWGVLRLVRRLRGQPGWAEVVACGLVLLGPPFLLDSAFWTQMDAVLGCLLVWAVYFLTADRRIAAGLCFGVALMMKAQAVLLVPVLAFIFVGLVVRAGWRRALRLWQTGVATLAVVVAVAIPAASADRTDPEWGGLRWVDRGYVFPITQQFPLTSLKAFNIWWLDFLLRGEDTAALQSDVAMLDGLTKDQVGTVLTLAALVAAAAACARRWRWGPPSWVAFAFLALLATFVFPTRAHERYIYYCLPFLVVAASVYRPWWPVVASLLLVGGFEMTWYLWLANPTAGDAAAAQSRGGALISLVLSVVTVASFLYALIAVGWSTSRQQTVPATHSAETSAHEPI
jgi:hypothetical protein